MSTDIVKLFIPTAPGYACSVRMLAASLAVADGFSVDDVEDVRMAAEEGFVYACSTGSDTCEIFFEISPGELTMDFSLGKTVSNTIGDDYEQGGSLTLVELLLSVICDEFSLVDWDGSDGVATTLHLVKRVAYAK